MSFSVTFDLLFVIAVIGGVLALIDGILRVRGRGSSIVAVIEIIVAALFLLSLFVAGIPLGSLILAIILLVLLVIWIVLSQGWIVIPGVNG